ncbi:MAG TPA: hypothetical protein VMZ69_05770, partial [Saprospiraceae bacterium]|nr:hypothetical protein [Saprospiraceae bacterium]
KKFSPILRKHSLHFLVYITLCTSACSEILLCSEKEIADPCTCTEDISPVCGCNFKTYSNSCIAECFGITQYIPGRCP